MTFRRKSGKILSDQQTIAAYLTSLRNRCLTGVTAAAKVAVLVLTVGLAAKWRGEFAAVRVKSH